MGEPKAPVPRPRALLRMLGEIRRGSAADAPLGLVGAVGELVRNAAEGSPLTQRDIVHSPEHVDLWNAKVGPGDMAPDFELPRLGGGEPVRLSAFRQVSPVALIFGSYT